MWVKWTPLNPNLSPSNMYPLPISLWDDRGKQCQCSSFLLFSLALLFLHFYIKRCVQFCISGMHRLCTAI
ncbi:hypothetical protein XENTR_v10011220 [Xenopus tropicalis]|nr:hypothetical protein XENTR_v10011220 [Xenopus tropicalis]